MYSAQLTLPASFKQSDIEKLSCALEDISSAHSAVRANHNERNEWIVEWIFEQNPQPQALTSAVVHAAHAHDISISEDVFEWRIAAVPDVNWLAHSYQQFPAFCVGPFYIYGSHHEGNVAQGQMGLQIDAATAFGSGEHGTTKGCLFAMLDLKGIGVCPWNILDMGTGSGILAIAAWKLWKTPILAVDIDEESIVVTKRHIELNNIPTGAGNVECAQSDGFEGVLVQKKKPYELVIANILASTLREIVDDLVPTIDDNGYVVLSGILYEQAQSVIDIYTERGLSLKKRYDIDEWSTLVMQRA